MMWKTVNAWQGSSWHGDGEWMILEAPAGSDRIVDAATGAMQTNAPFVYVPVEGDFTIRALVRQDFLGTYDAPALLALESDTRWVKACLEYTDLGTRAVVSVFTDGASDDCNGAETEADAIWLQLSRRGDVFAVHYSQDGVRFRMHRIARVKLAAKLSVGLSAQCPLGKGAAFGFSQVRLRLAAPEHQRDGND